MVYAVVTGGGTSGHVLPARAILELLIEQGHSVDELRYVGARRGIETELMKEFGVDCEFLPISGLQRSLSLDNIAKNIALPFRLLKSRWIAKNLIERWSPRVVVSVGGYASEPMARAAISHNVPLVCVSYDRVPGLATRRQAKHATVATTPFEGVSLAHSVIAGAPVRSEIRHLDSREQRTGARQRLGIPENATVITIVGGSLGSGALNAVVPQLLQRLSLMPSSVAVFHICGTRFMNEPCPNAPQGVWYRRVGYEDRMTDVYAASDVVVARAGASTVAEISTVGVASILVPWPGAADHHQDLNAQWLAEQNATVMSSDQQCESGEIIETIMDLIDQEERRSQLARSAREAGGIHRGNTLANAIQNAAR